MACYNRVNPVYACMCDKPTWLAGIACEQNAPVPQVPALSASLKYGPSGLAYVACVQGEFVDLGYIKAAHGVRGELKVELLTDSPQERFGKAGKTMYLRPPQPKGVLSNATSSQLFELVTAGCRMQVVAEGREVCLLKFKEVGDRDVAEALRGYMIVFPSSLRKPLQAKYEHYVQDLVGCQVFLQSDGTYIGRVADVISGFGTNDTLQLKLRPTKEDLDQSRVRVCMVPFAKEIVPLVDTHANRILVAPPEGLFDLATSKKAKKLDDQAKLEKLKEDQEREREEKERRASVSSGSSEPSILRPDDASDNEGSYKKEEGNDSKAAAARRAHRRRAAAGRRLRLQPPSS
eukprot:366406-Chlamydomonas_euryale.AAC.2